MRSSKRPALLGLAALSMSTGVTVAACKLRSDQKAKSSSAQTNSEMSMYEVVQCTPELCPEDVPLVGVNPTQEDLMVAMGDADGRKYDQIALGEDTSAEKVEGGNAEKALDSSSLLSKVSKSLFSDGENAADSPLGSVSLSALMMSLESSLIDATAAYNFQKNSVLGDTDESRAKLVEKMKVALADLQKNKGLIDSTKNTVIVNALVNVAGRDGWLNRGDLPRLLPVIPNVVGRVADQKIQQGYAQGIAKLAAENPYAYRRWVASPNGIIGSYVQKEINKGLNQAHGAKWQAVNTASTQFQVTYNKLMTDFGVTSYFLDMNDGKLYYDPAPVVTESDIDTIVQAMTGKRLVDVMNAAAATGRVPSLIPASSQATLKSLSSQFTMPDGLPIAEISQLVKASENFTKTVFPATLTFKLVSGDKIEIRRMAGAKPAASNASSDMEKNISSTPLACTALTKRGSDGVLMVYLYASKEGTAFSYKSGDSSWFVMPTRFAPAQGWPYIVGMRANAAWKEATTVRIKIKTSSGVEEECKATITHQ